MFVSSVLGTSDVPGTVAFTFLERVMVCIVYAACTDNVFFWICKHLAWFDFRLLPSVLFAMMCTPTHAYTMFSSLHRDVGRVCSIRDGRASGYRKSRKVLYPNGRCDGAIFSRIHRVVGKCS